MSHVSSEVFWLEFFEFLPFGDDDAAVGVFQAVDGGRSVSDFFFEDGFCVGHGYWVVAVMFASWFRSWFMIGMDWASLTSPVFGLNDKPRMAIRFHCRRVL